MSSEIDAHINIFGPINDLGYGVHTVNTAVALNKYIPVALRNSQEGPTRFSGPDIKDIFERSKRLNHRLPAISITHEWLLDKFCGVPRIGFPVFERTKLMPDGIHHMKQVDALFVPSAWAKHVVADNGIDTRCYVVPEGVSVEIFNPSVSASPALKRDVFTFLNVGKWEMRKNQLTLVGAFSKYFHGKEARLLGIWDNPFSPKWKQELHGILQHFGYQQRFSEKGHEIYQQGKLVVEVLPHCGSRADLAKAMKASDCAVFPFRSEGWGLPIIEAMALGIPTIATYFSGPTEYLTKETAVCLEPNEFCIEGASNSQWAEINESALGSEMLRAYDDLSSLPCNPEKVAREWNWDRAAQAIIHALLDMEIIRKHSPNQSNMLASDWGFRE